MVAVWLIGGSTALWLNDAYRPETTPALAGLYVSAGFFAHFYALLFMAGSRVRRTLFAGITTLLMALAALHHADEMKSRRVISNQQWVDIPQRPEWAVPIGCAVLFIILLWVHAVWLATGTRPKPNRPETSPDDAPAGGLTAPEVQPEPATETMSDIEEIQSGTTESDTDQSDADTGSEESGAKESDTDQSDADTGSEESGGDAPLPAPPAAAQPAHDVDSSAEPPDAHDTGGLIK